MSKPEMHPYTFTHHEFGEVTCLMGVQGGDVYVEYHGIKKSCVIRPNKPGMAESYAERLVWEILMHERGDFGW